MSESIRALAGLVARRLGLVRHGTQPAQQTLASIFRVAHGAAAFAYSPSHVWHFYPDGSRGSTCDGNNTRFPRSTWLGSPKYYESDAAKAFSG